MARLNNFARFRRHRTHMKMPPAMSKTPTTESTELRTMTRVGLPSELLLLELLLWLLFELPSLFTATGELVGDAVII